MSKPIIFFGNERFATGVSTEALIFQALIASGYEIKALIISQKPTKDLDLEIVRIAKDHNIEIKAYTNLKDNVEEIAAFNVDVAVLAAYGKIVPKVVLDIFKIGIINIHPSLLPKHRGPTPIESVILNGDEHTGVSIMRLAEQMDAGPVYVQRSIALNGSETKQELVDNLDELASKLLPATLESIMDGSLNPLDQDSALASYDQLITKQEGYLDWQDEWTSIERKSRAYTNWPELKCRIQNTEVKLLKLHPLSAQGSVGQYLNYQGQLAVYCKDRLVIIDELTPAGSKKMSGADFLRGYGSKLL